MQDFGIVWPFLIGLLGFLGFLLSRSYFQIQEGDVGVLIEFGRARLDSSDQKRLKIYEPGLHVKYPWQQVKTVSIKEQLLDLSGENDGTMAMTSDGTMLRLDSKLRYTPIADQLYNMLFAMKRPTEHVTGLFTCLLRNEIANFDAAETAVKTRTVNVGSYAVLRSQRQKLNQRINEFCRDQIGDKYGVRFDGVDLTDILPPDELAVALNSVFNAHSEAQKLYAQTESECEQRILSAEKGLTIAKAKASAVEAEIATMGDMLEEVQLNQNLRDYVERRKAEVYGESRVSYVRRKS